MNKWKDNIANLDIPKYKKEQEKQIFNWTHNILFMVCYGSSHKIVEEMFTRKKSLK